MKYLLFNLLFLFLGFGNVCFSQSVSIAWSNKPQAKHHFYAIEPDDSANIVFEGIGTCAAINKPTNASIVIYKNNLPIDTVFRTLTYIGNNTQISMTARVKGEIASYKANFQLGNTTVTADSMKAGLVFLCNGQSNMVAGYAQTLVSTNIPLDPYICTFGSSSHTNPVIVTASNTLRFFLGNPNTTGATASLGLTAFYMAKTIKDSLQLPICVLNGAKGGTFISEHLKRFMPNIVNDSLNIYGRLHLRVRNAGFQSQHIKGFFWYQGETDDVTPLSQYMSSFEELKDSLKKDYGQNLSIFVVQVRRECCNGALNTVLALQEFQRNLIQTANIKGVISANGLDTNGDYCHLKVNGYQKLGEQLGKMYCAHYRGKNPISLFPQPITAQLIGGNSQIKLLVSAEIDTIQLPYCKKLFRVSDGMNVFPVANLSAYKDTIFLNFSNPLPNNSFNLSYLGSLVQDTMAVSAKTGGTLLCFQNFIVSTNGQYNGTINTPCVGIPTTGTIAASSPTLCANQATTLTLVGSEMTTGIQRQWKYATNPLGPFTKVPNVGSTLSMNTGKLNTTSYYVSTLTCANSGDSATSPVQTIIVNALPIITCTPPSGTKCNSITPISLSASGANTYSWSPATGLSATVGANINANPNVSTAYTLRGTDSNGCVGSTTIPIQVTTPNLWAKATPPIVCPNATTQLSVKDSTAILTTPPTNYLPSIANVGTDEDIINVTLTGYLNNTSLCGALATGAGSIASRYSNYTTLTPPTILAGTTVNGAVRIKSCGSFAYSTGFAIFIDYNRNGIFEFPNETAVAQTPTPSSTGGGTNRTFSFTIPNTAFKGVTLMRVVAVESVSGLNGGISPTNPYMWGETEDYLINIKRINTSTGFVWIPFTSPAAGSNVTSLPVTTTTAYTVSGTDISGCINSTTVQVNSSNTILLAPSVTGPLCHNQPFTLSANATGANPITYSWDNSAGNTANVSLTLPAGTYTYTVTASNNCSNTVQASTTFTVRPLPNINITPNLASICHPQGTPVSLVASGGVNYSWTASTSQNTFYGTTLTANPNTTTTYTLKGTDIYGCKNLQTALINVSQRVTTTVIPDSSFICSHDSITLIANAVQSPYNGYCTNPHLSGCFGDNISEVTLNTLHNVTNGNCGGNGQYGFYNGGGTQTTELIVGNTYDLNVHFGSDPYQYCGVWIDFNQDNALTGADFVGASTTNVGAYGTYTLTFTVPQGAFNGITRLRIVGGNDIPIQSGQACGSTISSYGETEDYNISIIGGQTVPMQYAWSPSLFLDTTQGNIVHALNVTTPINYSVTATSTSGCQNTDIAHVAFYPNITADAGQNLFLNSPDCNTPLSLNANSTGTWSGGQGLFSDINNPQSTYLPAISEYNNNVTLTWTTNTQCPSSDTMQLIALSPLSYSATNVAPTDGHIYKADYEISTGNWTSYYDDNNTPQNQCDDYLLLSLMDGNSNGNAIGHTTDMGFDMTLNALKGYSILTYPNTPYVDYGATWYPMNRYWTLTPIQEPTSDLIIKYYFKASDVDSMNALFPGSTADDLKVYTINNNIPNTTNFDLNPISNHQGVPLATPFGYQGYGYWEYYEGSNPSPTNWSLSQIGNDYASEILTDQITGGGAGMGGAILVLPADILNFQGHNKGNQNLLEWISTSETNCKAYRLMKSPDNINFTPLITVNAKAPNGTSTDTFHYETTDFNPSPTTYYQVIQIDINGREKPSNIIQLTTNHPDIFFNSLYPNPTQSDLYISLFLSTPADCNIEIVDIAGKIVSTTPIQYLPEGNNTLHLKVDQLASGAYIAKIKNLTYGNTYHASFIKQ